MSFKLKNVLFCGELTNSSKGLIQALLGHNTGIKSLMIANTNGDCLERLVDPRLSHCAGDVSKIEGLEVIYTEALKQMKKSVHIVVNHRELSANDAWEDVITAHINSMICSTLMAIKHLGSMNAGSGGTVVNSIAIVGRTDDEYASIHRLLSDLDRAFSDPYYFNNTAVRILTMCTRMESEHGSDARAPSTSPKGPAEVYYTTCSAHVRPQGANVSRGEQQKKISEKFLHVCANKCSVLDQPPGKHIEQFEISIRN